MAPLASWTEPVIDPSCAQQAPAVNIMAAKTIDKNLVIDPIKPLPWARMALLDSAALGTQAFAPKDCYVLRTILDQLPSRQAKACYRQ